MKKQPIDHGVLAPGVKRLPSARKGKARGAQLPEQRREGAVEGKLEAHLSQSCVTEKLLAPPQGLPGAKMGVEEKRGRQPAFQRRLDKDTKRKLMQPHLLQAATVEQQRKERKTETACCT